MTDLILGDALDHLRALAPESFGACVTDPPYSSGGQFRGDRTRSTREKYTDADALHDLADFDGDTRDQRSFTLWSCEWMRQARKAVVQGGVLACFTDWRQLAATTDAAQMAGWVFRGIVTWHKPTGRPAAGLLNGHAEYVVIGSNGPAWWATSDSPPYVPPVIRANAPSSADRWHMTQKPLDVIQHILRLTPPGCSILDPFVGSGSTLIAAAATDRDATGFEVNATQYAVATERLRVEAPAPQLFDMATPIGEVSA